MVELEQRVGQMGGGFEFKRKFAVEVGGGDAFELGQRFHAALCLGGFGGFGFETVDKRLQVLDLGLLLGVGGLLLRQSLRALGLVEIVVAAVLGEFLVGQLHGLGGGGVEEIAVVRNDDLCAGEVGEVVFQPQHGFQIQVVGRFIEQQQIGAAHQRLGKVEAHAPAAGKRFYRRGVFGLGKTQSAQ